MIEIALIALCVVAANRWRQAGEKGVSKYILGVWGSLIGCMMLGGIILGVTGSMGVMAFFAIAGYGSALFLAIAAMRAGQGYLDYWNRQKIEEERQERQKLETEMSALKQQAATMGTDASNAPARPANNHQSADNGRMSSFRQSLLGSAVMGQSALCLKCGEKITFLDGASLASNSGHHDKVMCAQCQSVFSVQLTPSSMTLLQ